MAVVVAVTTAFVGCAPTAKAAPAGGSRGVPADCRHHHRPTVTLTTADNGRRICVRRDERVSVALSVDPRQSPDPAQWWAPVSLAGRALRVQPQVAMPPRGTTLGRYLAVAPGRAILSSARPLCAPAAGGPTCHSEQAWSVLILVR